MSVVPATHPARETADAGLLQHIDRVHADGSIREWAKVTHHVLKGLKHFRTGDVDQQVIEWALKQC
ncbi:hypothetical protein OG948_59395 (plasmid) [Embleya sp. NBC_00888]|uniref:hypothetical protein n=1 Tax=Embleya sp. NBC_00888 TaxID=2975960 RepID=UPI00386F5B4F|nr:hypothetical protein OG948_00040 [Embleya sp. NBC_00888]WSY43327.1 hypothetical protein OG948_34025 [Embleya sp. NBC_00888]WSY43721.1 hypothetical protein OG948_34100 [Embleya sp. NBC_00888]WSY48127.1 hypothetical protein OG948_59395 [Embleya sp. NBC_00888]